MHSKELSKEFSKELQKTRWRMLKGGLAPSVIRPMTRELDVLFYASLRMALTCAVALGAWYFLPRSHLG
ncbi:MAG: hypothetical protein WD601_07760 [Pseudohongiellaceae bacterium]